MAQIIWLIFNSSIEQNENKDGKNVFFLKCSNAVTTKTREQTY